MARVAVRVEGLEIKVESHLVANTMAMMNQRLVPKLWDVVEWYRGEVASFQYTYFDGYPHMNQRLREIILAASIKEVATVAVQVAGNQVFFRIRMFEDQPGCWLDKQTPLRGANMAGGLGWWRFFEFGAAGERNWGSENFGFVPSRRVGGRLVGWMAPIDGTGIKPRRPHPGVWKVGVFEKTWIKLRDDFRARVKRALQEVLQGK